MKSQKTRKNSLKKFTKLILKHSIVFTLSAVIGWIFTIIFIMRPLLLSSTKNVGLGVIALGPILFIIYSIISISFSGLLGVIIVIKLSKRKKKK